MEHRLDELARALAGGLSRREALRRLGGGLAAALLASLGVGRAWGQSGGVDCGTWCQGAVGFDPKDAASKQRYTACVTSCDDCQNGGGHICGTTTTGSVICCQGTDACCGTGCCPEGQACCNGTCCPPGQVCDGLTCAAPDATCCPGDRIYSPGASHSEECEAVGLSWPCQVCVHEGCSQRHSCLYAPGSRTGAQCDTQCTPDGFCA